MPGINAWLAEQDKPAAEPAKSPIRDWLVGTDQDAQLRLAAQEGIKTQPERAARILRLQYRTGLDAPFVDRNLDDVEYEAAKAEFDPVEFRKKSPLVASWLAEHPANFAAVQDDLESLSYIERQWNYIQGQAKRGGQTVDLADIGTSALLGGATTEQRQRQRDIEAELGQQQDFGITGFFEQIPGAVANQIPILARTLQSQAAGLAGGAAVGALGGAVGGAAVGGVAGGPAGILPGAGVGAMQGARAGALVGWRMGAAVSAAKMEASLAYLEYEQIKDESGSPIAPAEARGAALFVGAINGVLEGLTGLEKLTEKLPGLRALKRDGVKALLRVPSMRRALGSFAGEVIKTAGVEGLTEALQSLVTHSVGQLTAMAQDDSLNSLSGGEIVARLIDQGAIAEALAEARAGAQGGAGLSAALSTPTLAVDIARARQAQRNGDAFAAIGDGVAKSTTSKRAPEALREVLNSIEQNGDGKNVYVDSSTFSKYWQSVGADPREVAQELTGSSTAYDEAIETGGDFAIPLSAYALKIAPTEHGEFFARQLRAQPDQMSAAEAEEYFAQLDQDERSKSEAEERETAEDAGVDQDPTPARSADRVRDSVFTQLIESGLDRGTAERDADLHREVFATLAERSGRDALDLYNQYGLQIVRGAASRPSERVDDLDVLIDRLRTNDIPTTRDAFGLSLIESLRLKGIKDDGGELASRDVDVGLPPFTRKLIRDDGISLDDAARMAVESGFLPERDITALLDAMDQELGGKPIYAANSGSAQEAATRATLEDLRNALDELGVDIASSTNAQIKRHIRKSLKDEAAEVDPKLTRFNQGAPAPYNATAEEATPEPATPTKAEAKTDPAGYAQRVIDHLARKGVSVLASRAAKEFSGRRRGVELIGQSVESAADLAAVAQILRNPAFEVMRYIFVKGGKIVAHTAVSAHAPDHTNVIPEGADDTSYFDHINKISERVEADGVWLMHNHPSGRPTPSHADSMITKKINTKVRNLLGHVVIDTTQYAHIDPAGSYTLGDLEADIIETPTMTHSLLGAIISGPEDLADIAKIVDQRSSYFQIVGRSGTKLAGIAEVPLDFISQSAEIKIATIRRIGYALAAQDLFAINVPADQAKRFSEQTGNIWTDVISDKGRSLRETGHYKPDLSGKFYGAPSKTVQSYFQGEGKKEGDKDKGFIQFGPDRKFSIHLLENADPSTFLHESGHFFLEILGDLAQAPNARAQLKEDYANLLKHLGVNSREEIKTEHHEKFARTFEAYLREGKAPSASLRRAFAAFRAWLVWLYKSLKALDVELNDEVRGILDRLVATDSAIQAAKTETQIDPLFVTPEQAGLSPAEFERYRDTVQKASDRAQEQVQSEILRRFYREREASYREARAQIREQVERDVNAQQDQIALAALQRGTTPGGDPLPVAHAKLNRKELAEIMGEAFLSRLPKPTVYTAKGGISSYRAAEQFGYPDVQSFLLALANAKNRKELIESETDSRLRAQRADILKEGDIVDEAKAALQNEFREKVIELELAELRKRVREDRKIKDAVKDEQKKNTSTRRAGAEKLRLASIAPEHARELAESMIRRKRIADVHPLNYLRLMREASRHAVISSAAGDYEAAAAAKQRELLNYHLYRAALAAQEQVDSTLTYFGTLSKKEKRAEIGKAGSDYLEQIDGLLGRFTLKRMTPGQLERKEALAEWIRRKEASGASNGEEVVIDDKVRNEAFTKNYSELTVEELIGLGETIKQIATMATLETRLMASDRKQSREMAREELIASAVANRHRKKPLPYTKHGESTGDKVKSFGRGWDAALIKMEQIVDWLDGGDIAGPWRTYLFEGASRAQADEIDHSKTITERVVNLIRDVPKEIRAHMLDRVEISGLERVLTRRDVIGVALNWGNASNRDKLLRGQQWSAEQVEKMLARLTEQEWKFVQGVFDTLQTLWPEIEKLQREVTGLVPEKVVALPIITKFGTFPGGYYPIMYDPVASEQGALQLASTMGQLVEKGYTRATTPKGHTKGRLQAFTRPFNLDVDQLPYHIAGVVKDLTHRRWLIDANWLVNDSQIKQALRDTLGPEYVPLFSEWASQVVNDRHFNSLASLNVLRRVVEHARYNMLVASMGFKASTMIAQIAGIPNSIDVIGGQERDGLRWFGAGMVKSMKAPRETYRFVTEKSGEMRHRFDTRDRDLRDKLRLLAGREDWWAQIQRLALYGISLADLVISLPTWWGAYAKALEGGYDEGEAVSAGDRAVRLSQGAGGAKDLSSIAANRDLLTRTITMFYTPFSALYSRLRDIGYQFKSTGDVVSLASRLFGVWIVAAIVGELLAGRGPDDDEGAPEWALKLALVYPFLTVPVVRDLAGAVTSDYGYQFSPLAQVAKSTSRVMITARKVASDEADIEKLAADMYRASKYWLGLPVGQIEITGGYLIDLAAGNDEPESIWDFAHDLVYRRQTN